MDTEPDNQHQKKVTPSENYERFGPWPSSNGYDDTPTDGTRNDLNALENHPGPTPNTAGKPEVAQLNRADEQDDKLERAKSGFLRIEAANQQAGTEVGQPGKGNWFQRKLWASKKKKAATLAGSSGLLTIVIAIFSFLGISTGPLEFVHIAKILTGPFSVLGHVNAASDYRMGKLLYQIYKTGDLGTFDAGDTRLSIVGKALKKPVLQGLEDRGITPKYGTLKTFDGFTLDITNPKSPYYGLSPDAAMEKLQGDFQGSKKLTFSFADAEKTKIFVTGEGFNGDAAAIKATSAIVAEASDGWLYGKVASIMNSHFLFQYTEASTFHPLRKLQIQKTQQLVDLLKGWWNDRNEKLKTGVETSDINTASAKEQTQTTDQNGKTTTKTTDVPGETGPATADGIKAKLSGLKSGLSVAGALATVVAIVCLLQAVDHNIGAIRYTQVMLPMMREAMYAISVGSQIMTGQDVDMNEVNLLYSQFNAIDAQTHKITSTWSDAAPIESLSGGSGGTDMDPNMKDMFSGPPAWLKWTESGAVTTLCSDTAQVVTGVASVAIGIFSGEIANTAIGLIAGAIAGPVLINFVANLLAGNAIDPSTLAGAQWGNVIAYGARLAGNAQALQYGGVALNNQQVAQLDAGAEAQSQSEFHSESLADRIFNPYDYRSVVGSTIDQIDLSGGAQGIMATITNLPALFGSLIKTPLNIFGAMTHAAGTPYQYPFPEFGFSQADLTNPAVDDPVANAKIVGGLLDNNNTKGEPDYIQLGLDCFGVSITKGADGWDAVPSTAEPSDPAYKQDRTRGVNPYDAGTYNQGDCIKNNNLDWLRFRMWIYDTRLANGYNCYMGDQTSCNTDSFGSGGPGTNTPANSGNNIVWLNSGPGAEFDGVCDGCKDPISKATSFWISGQCSQASLAEVLNAYHMGKVLASTGVAGKGGVGPSNTGSDPLYKIIDVERASYNPPNGAARVWDGAFQFTSHTGAINNIMGSWMTEADLFHMKLTYYSGDAGNPNHIDNSMASLKKIVDIANAGNPVITSAPNHWLVIWGGDENADGSVKDVFLLDSSGHDFTWAPQSTADSITMDGPHQVLKVPAGQFISGLASSEFHYYWGADANGNNPSPIAVVLTPQ